MKKITPLDVKHALKDERFRASLPDSLKPGAEKFMRDPGCACHHNFIKNVIKEAKEQLSQYYPSREAPSEDEMLETIAKNNWRVINCHIDELESKLQKLPQGRKQLDIARWEDQVTIVINELEVLF